MRSEKIKVFVGTGWYSTLEQREYKHYGDDIIRAPEFRPLWWSGLKRFISPDAVIVVDSASPVKPPEIFDPNLHVEIIELAINPGHSTVCPYHYSGWTASVILSLEYAYACGADIYFYVEQDVLLYGDKIRSEILNLLNDTEYVFGDGKGTPQLLQQSFFAIRRSGIRRFLSHLHMIEKHDREMSPETKFHLAATSLFWAKIILFFYDINKFALFQNSISNFFLSRLNTVLFRLSRKYKTLGFGFGRVRPIDFDDDMFYFQHASRDEIEIYKRRIGL